MKPFYLNDKRYNHRYHNFSDSQIKEICEAMKVLIKYDLTDVRVFV